MTDHTPSHESIVITRDVPGLDEALEKVPTDWDVWATLTGRHCPATTSSSRSAAVPDCSWWATGVDEDLLAHAPGLRVVSQYGVGLDNIDLDATNAGSL